MPNLTLSQIASRVLRNVEIPEDASTTQALADVKQYVNERARDIWKRRPWGEYNIHGTFTVPADTRIVNLSDIVAEAAYTSGNGYRAGFAEIISVRQGDARLLAEDQGAVDAIRPSWWDNESLPTRFVNQGKKGIRLLGVYATATELSFFGKADFQDLTDAETWVMDNENALIFGASADFLKFHERDDNRADKSYQQYEAEVSKLVSAAEAQRGNAKRIIPRDPFTDSSGLWGTFDDSKTGTGRYF